jgi:hypothetical protein
MNVCSVGFRTFFAAHQELQPAVTARRDAGEEQSEFPAQQMQPTVVIDRIPRRRPSLLFRRRETISPETAGRIPLGPAR